VCVGTVSVEVENAACPLPLRTVGPERTIPGAAQFAPSINVTLPVVTAVTPTFTEAVNVTLFPKVDGFADDATVVDVFALPLNVTVTVALEPATPVQGLVVPEQVVGEKSAIPLHPVKFDPLLAAALRVIVAPLMDVVMFGEHVLVTV
jgi:hypothetical protein